MDVMNAPLDQVVTPEDLAAWAAGVGTFQIRTWMAQRMRSGFLQTVCERDHLPRIVAKENAVYSSDSDGCLELYKVMYEELTNGAPAAPEKKAAAKEEPKVEEKPAAAPKRKGPAGKLAAARAEKKVEEEQKAFNPDLDEVEGKVVEEPSAGAVALANDIEAKVAELRVIVEKHESRITAVEEKVLKQDRKILAAYEELLKALRS